MSLTNLLAAVFADIREKTGMTRSHASASFKAIATTLRRGVDPEAVAILCDHVAKAMLVNPGEIADLGERLTSSLENYYETKLIVDGPLVAPELVNVPPIVRERPVLDVETEVWSGIPDETAVGDDWLVLVLDTGARILVLDDNAETDLTVALLEPEGKKELAWWLRIECEGPGDGTDLVRKVLMAAARVGRPAEGTDSE